MKSVILALAFCFAFSGSVLAKSVEFNGCSVSKVSVEPKEKVSIELYGCAAVGDAEGYVFHVEVPLLNSNGTQMSIKDLASTAIVYKRSVDVVAKKKSGGEWYSLESITLK